MSVRDWLTVVVRPVLIVLFTGVATGVSVYTQTNSYKAGLIAGISSVCALALAILVPSGTAAYVNNQKNQISRSN